MTEEPVLTNREREVLKLVAEGMTNNEISVSLSISVYTVKEHRKKLNKKLGTNNPILMLRAARSLGLIQ